jgi:hypothetical protein
MRRRRGKERMVRSRWTATLMVLASLACGPEHRARKWITPLLDVNCGSMQLRFEERGEFTGFPSGASFYTPTLSINKGAGWQVVDQVGSHSGPFGYPKLLPASAKFRVYPLASDRYTVDPYWYPTWDIFIDPKLVNDDDYRTIASCIASNLADIDRVYDTKREPDNNFELSTQRRYRVSSIIHHAHDERFTFPERVALGVLWECPGGDLFLKTEPPDWIVMCSTKERFCDLIGRVSNDQSAIVLVPPKNPGLVRMAGPQWKEKYGSCRDSSGRGLYDVLKPGE